MRTGDKVVWDLLLVQPAMKQSASSKRQQGVWSWLPTRTRTPPQTAWTIKELLHVWKDRSAELPDGTISYSHVCGLWLWHTWTLHSLAWSVLILMTWILFALYFTGFVSQNLVVDIKWNLCLKYKPQTHSGLQRLMFLWTSDKYTCQSS